MRGGRSRLRRVFMEVHPDPDSALSDGPNMVPPLMRFIHSLNGYYVYATQPPHNRSGNRQDQDIRRAFCQRRCERARGFASSISKRARCSISKPVWMSGSRAVTLLYECQGKVVISGMGKSGLIGQKIAATLASTGTPSFFLHPAEGVHGDLGMLARRDVLIAISNSGETQEVLQLLPSSNR